MEVIEDCKKICCYCKKALRCNSKTNYHIKCYIPIARKEKLKRLITITTDKTDTTLVIEEL